MRVSREAGLAGERHLPAAAGAGPSGGWGMAGCSTSASPTRPCSPRLDMIERAPAADLPPAHVGIHTVQVISQDGDVYGKTVNLAARIAAYAQAGQVKVSEGPPRRSDHHDLPDQRHRGVVDLKGVAEPLPLYQALRRP